MVVLCTKCNTKLKIDDSKIAPQGTRFKCPKCQTVLTVKKSSNPVAPSAPEARPAAQSIPESQPGHASEMDKRTAMVAHADAQIVERIRTVLSGMGIHSFGSTDGVETMVTIMKERPYLIFVDVALPKIYGYEIIRRLRSRPETKDMRAILISSIYDKRRYRREPASLYGADDYIDEHEIEDQLPRKVKFLLYQPTEPREKTTERPVSTPEQEPLSKVASSERQFQPKTAVESKMTEKPALSGQKPAAPLAKEPSVEKARRLARTILADIDLYAPEKVNKSIKNNSFESAFASELKEGKKLYEARIPEEIKNQGDFFGEAIKNFLDTKKKSLSI